MTTAAGFNLSASLQIAFPASPSTMRAIVFTYRSIITVQKLKTRNAQLIEGLIDIKVLLDWDIHYRISEYNSVCSAQI